MCKPLTIASGAILKVGVRPTLCRPLEFFDLGSTVMIVGRRGSGKSILAEYISNSFYFANQADRVFRWSSLPDDHVLGTLSMGELTEESWNAFKLVRFQLIERSKTDVPYVTIIIDNFYPSASLKKVFKEICNNNRCYRLNVIVCVQNFLQLDLSLLVTI